MDITLIDHVVVTQSGYRSIAEYLQEEVLSSGVEVLIRQLEREAEKAMLGKGGPSPEYLFRPDLGVPFTFTGTVSKKRMGDPDPADLIELSEKPTVGVKKDEEE